MSSGQESTCLDSFDLILGSPGDKVSIVDDPLFPRLQMLLNDSSDALDEENTLTGNLVDEQTFARD